MLHRSVIVANLAIANMFFAFELHRVRHHLLITRLLHRLAKAPASTTRILRSLLGSPQHRKAGFADAPPLARPPPLPPLNGGRAFIFFLQILRPPRAQSAERAKIRLHYVEIILHFCGTIMFVRAYMCPDDWPMAHPCILSRTNRSHPKTQENKEKTHAFDH